MHKTKEYQLQEIERLDARIKALDDEKNIWLNAFHTKQEENGQLTCSLHDKTEKLEMREQELSETQNVLQQTQDVVQAQVSGYVRYVLNRKVRGNFDSQEGGEHVVLRCSSFIFHAEGLHARQRPTPLESRCVPYVRYVS